MLDVFASNITAKTQKFFSRYWCENSAGVDAFAYDWSKQICWEVPPPYLIPKTIKHMQMCHANGIMIVPKWKASVFWPTLHNGKSWKVGISLIKEFSKPANFFLSCLYGNDKFTAKPFDGNVLVLLIDFRQ